MGYMNPPRVLKLVIRHGERVLVLSRPRTQNFVDVMIWMGGNIAEGEISSVPQHEGDVGVLRWRKVLARGPEEALVEPRGVCFR